MMITRDGNRRVGNTSIVAAEDRKYASRAMGSGPLAMDLYRRYGLQDTKVTVIKYLKDEYNIHFKEDERVPKWDNAWRLMGERKFRIGGFIIGMRDKNGVVTVSNRENPELLQVDLRSGVTNSWSDKAKLHKIRLCHYTGPVKIPTPIDNWAYEKLRTDLLSLEIDIKLYKEYRLSPFVGESDDGSKMTGATTEHKVGWILKPKTFTREYIETLLSSREYANCTFPVFYRELLEKAADECDKHFFSSGFSIHNTLTWWTLINGVAHKQIAAVKKLYSKKLMAARYVIWEVDGDKLGWPEEDVQL